MISLYLQKPSQTSTNTLSYKTISCKPKVVHFSRINVQATGQKMQEILTERKCVYVGSKTGVNKPVVDIW